MLKIYRVVSDKSDDIRNFDFSNPSPPLLYYNAWAVASSNA